MARRRFNGPPPVVEVVWHDACMRTSAVSLSTAAKESNLCVRRTVGYLVHKGRDKIVLAMTYDAPEAGEDGAVVDDRMTIPRGWVRGLKTLR